MVVMYGGRGRAPMAGCISVRTPSDTFFLCPLHCVLITGFWLHVPHLSVCLFYSTYCLVAATSYTNVELAHCPILCVKKQPRAEAIPSANDTPLSRTSPVAGGWPQTAPTHPASDLEPLTSRRLHLARGQYLHGGPLVLSQASPSTARPAFADLGSLVSISILP